MVYQPLKGSSSHIGLLNQQHNIVSLCSRLYDWDEQPKAFLERDKWGLCTEIILIIVGSLLHYILGSAKIELFPYLLPLRLYATTYLSKSHVVVYDDEEMKKKN